MDEWLSENDPDYSGYYKDPMKEEIDDRLARQLEYIDKTRDRGVLYIIYTLAFTLAFIGGCIFGGAPATLTAIGAVLGILVMSGLSFWTAQEIRKWRNIK